MTKINRQERLKQITEKLENGVRDLFISDKYLTYLKVMSRFHRYSLNNQILIAIQKPDASLVAGYKTWQTKFSRTVKHGEKAIYILGPVSHQIEKEVILADGSTQKQEISYMTFRPVPVFSAEQTEGEELPTICQRLTGTVEGYKDLISKLEAVSPVPVSYEEIKGGANGYYHLLDKKIVIQSGMTQEMTVKTLIHEISHALLHDIDLGTDKDADRMTREIEAESTAYAVLQYLGIDSSDYSFGYIAGWSSDKDTKELKRSLEMIRSTADTIITGIEAA